MSNEDRLFKYKFIKKISQSDSDSQKKKEYIKQHEKLNNKVDFKSDDFGQDTINNIKYKKQIIPKEGGKSNILLKKTLINIDSRLRDLEKYPYAHDFYAPFGKIFNNVKSIRLVSSEIPNSDQVIREFPTELQNNTMYWINNEDADLNYITDVTIETIEPDTITIQLNSHNIITSTREITIYNSKLDTDLSITGVIDGKYLAYVIDSDTIQILYKGGIPISGTASIDIGLPIYFVEFKPGNYTATTLTEQMQKSFNLIKRRNDVGQYHFMEVSVNLDTDVITFDNVITTQLQSSPITTTAASNTITVNSFSHGLKTGDRVKMIDVRTLAGIPGTTLSGNFTITVLDFNTFTYEVNTRAIESVDGGGNTVKIGKDAPFKFLLDTQNTLIQYNTGFADENSTEAIGSSNSMTTKILNIEDITIINEEYIRITTEIEHSLYESTILEITNISTSNPCEITTSTPHNFGGVTNISLRNTNSSPSINNEYSATPTGVYTFIINKTVNISGNSGQVIYDGDRILLSGLKSTPELTAPFYYVENITSPFQFDIRVYIIHIDTNTINSSIVRTSQVTVNHPAHGFSNINSIIPNGTLFSDIRTDVPHKYSGSYYTGIQIIDGPISTNTIDILLENHGLITSDVITIIDSTSDPTIDGVYNIQLVTADIIRINYVHSSFVDGIGSVFSGDKINITNSNSLPKIDGYWYINNKHSITNITDGSTEPQITYLNSTNWEIGDTIVISGSDCIPNIDGEHVIYDIISPTVVSIQVLNTIIAPGTIGKITNKNFGTIYTNFQVTTSGDSAILGRSQNVIHYRCEAEFENGDNIGGIPLNNFNGIERKIVNIVDYNNYMIRIENFYATKNISSGGSNIRVSSELHGNRSIQANTDTGESDGKLFRSISLEGENYIYMVIPELGNIQTSNTAVKDVFAKIILTQSPGLMTFDSFISSPKEFDSPLAKLDSLRIKMIDYRGFPFDFHDLNYSITLEVIEVVEVLENTNIRSKSSSGMQDFDKKNKVTFNDNVRQSGTVKSSSSSTVAGGRFGITRGSR